MDALNDEQVTDDEIAMTRVELLIADLMPKPDTIVAGCDARQAIREAFERGVLCALEVSIPPAPALAALADEAIDIARRRVDPDTKARP
jgi:hypothetical protein